MSSSVRGCICLFPNFTRKREGKAYTQNIQPKPFSQHISYAEVIANSTNNIQDTVILTKLLDKLKDLFDQLVQ